MRPAPVVSIQTGRDARDDYRMCVEEGVLSASDAAWRSFLAGYLADEEETSRRVPAYDDEWTNGHARRSR